MAAPIVSRKDSAAPQSRVAHTCSPCAATTSANPSRYLAEFLLSPSSSARARPLSGIGFLGRRPLVPVGAGVVMGWVGTLVVARVPLDGRTTGDHKGPHSTTQPLPPLRGRSRFPCLFAQNLYLKGGLGLPRRPSPPTIHEGAHGAPLHGKTHY